MYNYKESKNRVEEILTSTIEVVKKDKIPNDNEFTYTNGIKTWVGAIFVDIVNSSDMCLKPDNDTARVLRAFCSEIIAILKDDPNYCEIGIRGDCVYSINSTPTKMDLITIFQKAYRINTFMTMFNRLLKDYDYDTIDAGIGLGCSEDLVIKSGHYGSGINDKIWVGKAVVDACNLSNIANRKGISPIAMNPCFYDNVIEILKKENPNYSSWIKKYTGFYSNDNFYHCNIIETIFNDWIEEGMN